MRVFIINCSSTLVFSNIEIEEKPIFIDISQSSLLSLILYLFYVAELLELCNNLVERLSICGFANDINMLAYN